MDVIQRNIERLISSDTPGKREPLEPLSAWKWQRLYKITREYAIGGYVAEGLRRHEGDFFRQLSPALLDQFMALDKEKNPEALNRYLLHVTRSRGWRYRLSQASLRAYFSDFFFHIRNIEE